MAHKGKSPRIRLPIEIYWSGFPKAKLQSCWKCKLVLTLHGILCRKCRLHLPNGLTILAVDTPLAPILNAIRPGKKGKRHHRKPNRERQKPEIHGRG